MHLSNSADHARHALALAFCLCTLPCLADNAPVAFRTRGGDAWTFDKHVELSVSPERCDDVVITSPAGVVAAEPHHGNVVTQIPLASGDNMLTAECRRGGRPSGVAAHQTWRVRLDDKPKAHTSLGVTAHGLELIGTSEPARPAGAAIVRYEWRGAGTQPSTLRGLPAHGPRVTLPIPPNDGDYRVALDVTDANGRTDSSTVLFQVTQGAARAIDPMRAHPAWMEDAVVYGVVPALFGAHGLADVTRRLDDLAGLGVNALWLSPITPAPANDFGYATTDYFNVRPSFGSAADLHALIAAAHARRMRVILDFVANHLSDQNDYFADAAANRQASAYFDFFVRDAAGTATHYFNWSNLKNLNYDNPEVRRMVIEGFAHWVRAFDVDGFRVDAAWGPRERAPDFWTQWATELQRIKPDVLLLAEASSRDPYYAAHGFDAAYDWTDQLGEWAWHAAFEDSARVATRLRTALSAAPSSGAAIFRFLENNDTGARFVTRYGAAWTRVAAAMLLTLPGLPALFTGQEVGAEYTPYKTTVPLSWHDRYDLRAWYTRLISLRHELPVLRSHEMRLLDVASSEQVLAYLRPATRSENSVIVLLNYGSEAVHIPRDRLTPGNGRTPLVDLLTGAEVASADTDPDLMLPGSSALILQPR
jgi:glycosidase